jgi:hypothetical protein
VHYTPAGYDLMAGWLAQQVAAPSAQAVDPPVGDGGLGPLLLNPMVFPGLTVQAAQRVDGAVDRLAAAMSEIADEADTPGADDARTANAAPELLRVKQLWRAVVAAAPVVAGD